MLDENEFLRDKPRTRGGLGALIIVLDPLLFYVAKYCSAKSSTAKEDMCLPVMCDRVE